ncbi:hypothetical protein OEA41_004270 [Lepraria neglecta]|uniref:Uncharacterized protein n=1 Tax=Lepraria neglecta TaxID=209136 RepID=A0AAD9YXJ5_9LECA|nr:hypothetical protein OEA41_004270 [Lepraria neglecta]
MNCEATLLAHAELYNLACDYQPHDLQALEPLRKLMASFIAYNFNNFDDGDGGAVQRLLDAETDFSGDVIPMVRINMTALGKKLKDSEDNAARLEESLREAQKETEAD